MKGLKTVGTFIFGAACGAAGVFFGLKQHYKEQAEKEVAEARKAFHSIMKRRRANQKTEETDIPNPPEETHEQEESKQTVNRSQKSYSDLIRENGYSEADGSEPYQVEYSKFQKSPPYQQVYLFWFAEDRCLCNANTGRGYAEIEELLGSEGMELLLEASPENEDDKFYICNEKLNVVFCVQLEFLQHYEDIFGDGPEE